jgi:hypothetical protein
MLSCNRAGPPCPYDLPWAPNGREKPMPKAKLAFASFSRCTEDFARLVRRSEGQDWRLIVDYGHDYG